MRVSRSRWAAGAAITMASIVSLATIAAATTPPGSGDGEATASSASHADDHESDEHESDHPGSDEHESDDHETTAPAMTAPGGTFDQQFCDTWVEFEHTVARPPEDADELATWYPETVAPIVADLRDHAPDEIADAVNTYLDGVEQSATGEDSEAMSSPDVSSAVLAIYPSFADGCGITVVSALMTDYAFGGVPETLTAGPTAFVVLNNSAKGEAHEMVVFRLKDDDADLSLDDLLAMPEAEQDEHATFINEEETPGPGAASGMILDLTPGTYLYACYVTLGSIDGTEGTGPPHAAAEGMGGEFIVS